VSPEQIETLLDNIEEHIRREGKEEIPSTLIGEYVMDELEKVDQVAYIRFASVYRAFADITHFQKEVQKLTKKS
jgi:transcriptional repressor NrdR